MFVALDATDEVIEAAVDKKADMLITHHPMLMSGMKKINTDDFMGRKIIRLIQMIYPASQCIQIMMF